MPEPIRTDAATHILKIVIVNSFRGIRRNRHRTPSDVIPGDSWEPTDVECRHGNLFAILRLRLPSDGRVLDACTPPECRFDNRPTMGSLSKRSVHPFEWMVADLAAHFVGLGKSTPKEPAAA